jgi:aminodeoxychorismate lyase
MKIFINGRSVPEEEAVVSVLDRGFLYGDGLFETLRVVNGKPFRWHEHWARLQAGARFLKIALPYPADFLLGAAIQLVADNGLPDSLLRVTLTRGVGLRGYSPKGADRPTLTMTVHPTVLPATAPVPRWRVVTSSFRLAANEPLAQFKTCNKLPQILARAEADAAGADEAVLTNTEGCVVEGSSSNLFWIQNGQVCTPPLASGILPGVTRAAVLELCGSLGISVCESNIAAAELPRAQAVFFSLSSFGVVEAESLDGQALSQSPLVEVLRAAYARLVAGDGAAMGCDIDQLPGARPSTFL